MSRPGLYVPKVTVASARTAVPRTSPVSASMPLGRSTATTVPRTSPMQPLGLLPQAALAADADDAVEDQVGLGQGALGAGVGGHHASARRAQGAQAPGVGAVGGEQDGGDAGAAPGEPGPGVERVAAVVAAAGQQGDTGPVDPVEQVGAGGGEPGCRALHECSFGQPRHQVLFSGSYGLDAVGDPHGPSLPNGTHSALGSAYSGRTYSGSAHSGTSPVHPRYTRRPERLTEMDETPMRARAVVDLTALRDNVRALRDAAPTAELMAVVKSDGYGHGAVPCARAARAAGAGWLGVATPEEALALRAAGDRGRLMCWLWTPGGPWRQAIEADIDVSASGVWALREAVAAARACGRTARVQLKADTGLGRNGCPPADWPELVAEARAAEAEGRSG